MGGRGSGGWNASGRATLEDTLHLNATDLQHQGCLLSGAKGRLEWLAPEGASTVASLESIPSGLELAFNPPPDLVAVSQHLSIDWVPCPLGGQRPYFLCPDCGRRVVNLYLSSRFRCRTCTGLTYQSQRERAHACQAALKSGPASASKSGPGPRSQAV